MGVSLEVWQVNARGEYDMDSPIFHLRGSMKTGTNGQYAFDTIMPVAYGRRPKHIHFMLTRAGYEPRITQCYDGDDRNATDPYVKPNLIVTTKECVRPTGSRACAKGSFGIALVRERLLNEAEFVIYQDYVGDYQVAERVVVTVSVSGRRLRWHLSAGEDPNDALDGEFLPRSQSRFFITEYDEYINFVRDESGRVTHALLSRTGLIKKIR